MNRKTFRLGLAGAAMAATLLAVPTESHAIFHWLSRCCGGGAPTYGAAPLFNAAPAAADPCCAPQVTQTTNYVPQTCYRTQYVNVPVTTYRPVTGCDPCTGCPVTCMRPTTSYVRQAQLVPYTTYRRVLSNPCGGAAASTVMAGYAPAYGASMSYASGSSCSSCGGASMTYAPAASAPYYSGPAASTVVSPSTSYGSSNGGNAAPTLAPPPGGTPTFKGEDPIPEIKVEKPADQESEDSSASGAASGTGTTLSPRLFQPNDRTTLYPILRARIHRPVSYNEPSSTPDQSPKSSVNDDGWRPSTR